MSGRLDERRVAAARLWAASRFPYLASAVFATRLLPVEAPGVVAVDESWRVLVDPDLVTAWRPDQLGSVLVHHVGHLLRDHAGRARGLGVRPSRRAAAVADVVLPAMRRPVPEAAAVVDTSGSMDEDLLGRALAEVDGLVRSLGQRILRVLSCDAAVHAVQRVTAARQVELLGGGGTNMGEGIAAAGRLRPAPAVVVVLTDGFTPWPPAPPRGLHVIVALLREGGRQPPDWARVVRVEPR